MILVLPAASGTRFDVFAGFCVTSQNTSRSILLFRLHAWNCEYRQAIAYASQEIDLAQRCQAPYLLRHVYTHLTVMYALAGEMAEAESAYAEARTVVERLAAPEAWAYFDLIAGILPMARGDYAASEQVAVRAIEAFRAANPNTLV